MKNELAGTKRKNPEGDYKPHEDNALMRKMVAAGLDYFDTLGDVSQPVVKFARPSDICKALDDCGVGADIDGKAKSDDAILKACETTLEYSVRTGHPWFFNQLYARGEAIATGADIVSTLANTNEHTYEVAPVFTVLEHKVLAKFASVLGYSEYDGLFVPSGSFANLYGMQMARFTIDPDFRKRGAYGGPRLVAFTSDQSHYSYLKGSQLLGIGTDNLISVPADSDGAMIPSKLEEAIQRVIAEGGKPFFVGATAGTTVLGAYDPIRELSAICKKHGMWLHIDGAWGGGVMLSKTHRHLIDGIELTDSYAFNAHKMLGMPLACSVFMTSHRDILATCNATRAAYLFQKDKENTEQDMGDKTIQCGRKVDGYKMWMAWKKHGDEGLERIVDSCYDTATYMLSRVKSSNGVFQMAYKNWFANVCFWYIPDSLKHLRNTDISKLDKDSKDWNALNAVAPVIKSRMQHCGEAMIGFQSVNGLPNFWRMVFPACQNMTNSDIDGVIASFHKHAADL